MGKKEPKKYKVPNWKIDHPFVGLELMLKAVIRFTQKDFPDKTPQERFHKIMGLLFKENKILQKRGPKELGFEDDDMNEWTFYLLIAQERIEYFKEHGKELPVKHAIKKHIHLVKTHGEEKNAVKNWSKAYSTLNGELEDEEKIAQTKTMIELAKNQHSVSEKLAQEMFQSDKQNAYHEWKDNVRDIKKFLRTKKWPI